MAKFNGVIDLDVRKSTPDWTPYEQPKAPDGAPNVMFIVWDDTGFGALEPFGGPIEMPTLRRLCDGGLRYSQFHTTAICSSTAPSMLTGRNHTTVGMACIAEGDERLSRLERAHPVRDRDDRRGARRAGLQHVHGRQVALSCPRTRRTWRRRSATGRPAAGSSASTGTSVERRTSGTPTSCRTSSSSTSRLTRRRTGRRASVTTTTTCRRTWSTSAISMIADCQAGRTRSSLLHVLLPRRRARAAPRAEGMDRQVQGPLRRGVRSDPREHPGQSEEAGLGAGERRSSRRSTRCSARRASRASTCGRRRRAAVGLAAGGREGHHAPHGRGVRRVLQLHRPRDRTADRLPRAER